MTREELFPRSKFPVRKKTSYAIPEKRLKFYIELYFEKTDGVFERQRVGEYAKITSDDGTVALISAKVIYPDRTVEYYLETNGALESVSEETLEEKIRSFEKEFQEKYKIIVIDEDADQLMLDALDSAKWTKF